MLKIKYFHNRGFGDYLINRFVRQRVSGIDGIDIVASYIAPLHEAVFGESTSITVDWHQKSTPSFFNLKKANLIEITASISSLRKKLRQAEKEYPDHILFLDHKRMFQDILFGVKSYVPPPKKNVYLSHLHFYSSLGLAITDIDKHEINNRGNKILSIFPNSSNQIKNLDYHTLSHLDKILKELNQEYKVIYLVGEQVEFPQFPSKVIPKNFQALKNEIIRSKLVIAADSMPGHLAHFLGIPVFSVLPQSNVYWLPYRTFREGHYSVFEQICANGVSELYYKLQKFL